MGIDMLKPLVDIDDVTVDEIAEAKDDGRITSREAAQLIAHRRGRITELAPADEWALRIRLTERTRQRTAWALGRHYATMAETLHRLVGRADRFGITFKTADGEKFTGPLLVLGPANEGTFSITPEFGDAGRGRTFHFDEIPVDCFGTYNR